MAQEERSFEDVKKGLQGLAFPATRNDIIRYAQERQATPAVMSALQTIPERDYGSWDDLHRGFEATH